MRVVVVRVAVQNHSMAIAESGLSEFSFFHFARDTFLFFICDLIEPKLNNKLDKNELLLYEFVCNDAMIVCNVT